MIRTSIGDMRDPVDRFFAYARERHCIYLRRETGVPKPWTKDPILRGNKFTNVFRELDAVTRWFREHVREPMRDDPDVFLATIIFRWFNRVSTGEAIFCQQAIDGRTCWERRGPLESIHDIQGWTREIKATVRAYCGGGPYVTGSYTVTTPAGMDKLTGMCKNIETLLRYEDEQDRTLREMRDTMVYHPGKVELRYAWDWLRGVPFQGDFHSYEVVTDLRHTRLLDKAPDICTWANPGPGARRGVARLGGLGQRKTSKGRDVQILAGVDESMATMQMLLAQSRLSRYWPQPHGDVLKSESDVFIHSRRSPSAQWSAWEMREVEHTLCEWDKYERVRLGQGRPRGSFNGG